MKYLLDGYNIIFRRSSHHDSLEQLRLRFFKELDLLAKALSLNIIVVLDAYKQVGELKRGHFQSLEIIFTEYGQTADEYILKTIQRIPSNQKGTYTVVSSDRQLAHQVASESINVLSVSSFFRIIEKKMLSRYPGNNKRNYTVESNKSSLPQLMDTNAWIKLFEEGSPKVD